AEKDDGVERIRADRLLDIHRHEVRYSIAVGFMRLSPRAILGKWTRRAPPGATPPARSTPRFTASASERKCRLQLTSSDHELQIPTTGRPESALREMPSGGGG